MLNFLSRTLTLTLTLTLKQHSFKNQTNPNPVNTFYWHPFEFVHFFMHTYPTPLPIPTLPCFWAFALWCIWKCLLFCAWYHYVSCNKYLPFQLCSSWKVLSPWRGDILFFICTHPPHPHPPLSPSLRVSFWIVGLRYYLDPSDRVRLWPRVFLTPLYYYVTFTYALKTPTK